MPGSSILPVALFNEKLYFLFGKENPMEDSSHGYSDFGGGIDKGEIPFDTALREGCEELTGFLGNKKQLKKLIQKNGGYLKLVYNETGENPYYIHIFHLPYDDSLPYYYNLNHEFLWNKMDKKLLNDTKLFEKINIKWTCEDDLLKNKKEYRHFYVDIIRMIVDNIEKIRKFIKKNESFRKTL